MQIIEDLAKFLGQTGQKYLVLSMDQIWLEFNCFRFQLFSPFTALALAPVEAHYSVVKVISHSPRCTPPLFAQILLYISPVCTNHIAHTLFAQIILHTPCLHKSYCTPPLFAQAKPLPYYGPPGSGLNGGVALMNLTRSDDVHLKIFKEQA